MQFKTLVNFDIETSEGTLCLQQGQIIEIDKSEAIPMLEDCFIIPVEKVAYKIFSKLLQAYLWVVADEEEIKAIRASQGITEAIYTADEIRIMKGMEHDALKTINAAKEIFNLSTVEKIDMQEKKE